MSGDKVAAFRPLSRSYNERTMILRRQGDDKHWFSIRYRGTRTCYHQDQRIRWEGRNARVKGVERIQEVKSNTTSNIDLKRST